MNSTNLIPKKCMLDTYFCSKSLKEHWKHHAQIFNSSWTKCFLFGFLFDILCFTLYIFYDGLSFLSVIEAEWQKTCQFGTWFHSYVDQMLLQRIRIIPYPQILCNTVHINYLQNDVSLNYFCAAKFILSFTEALRNRLLGKFILEHVYTWCHYWRNR